MSLLNSQYYTKSYMIFGCCSKEYLLFNGVTTKVVTFEMLSKVKWRHEGTFDYLLYFLCLFNEK